MAQDLRIITTGGTFDKQYDAISGELTFRESQLPRILGRSRCTLTVHLEGPLAVDSLYMTDKDRQKIYDRVSGEKGSLIVITHGTDTMVETARTLKGIPGKVIVLTGAMQPARFKSSDAEFNIGAAATAVQLLSPGVYIVMNGRVLDPDRVKKNRRLHRFEEA